MDDFFVRNRLSAYLDGELPTSEAREVEAALSRSPALRAEYEQLRRVVAQLRQEGPLEAPARFKSALSRRLAEEPMPGRWRRWLPPVRVEAFALAAIALVALVLVARSGSGPDAGPAETVAVTPPTDATTPVPSKEPGAPPDAVAQANGVLGDEAKPVAAAGRQSMAETKKVAPSSTKSAPKTEKEPMLQSWENTAEPETSPVDNTANSTSLYSPPPFRYRLRTESQAALTDLAAVAAELGGKLVDQNGRTVATYPMETGDARSVRVVVPSYNVEALHARLRELGDVETMATDATLLYVQGTDVPVAIEVQRE